MEILLNLYENSQIPVISAFLLGLMTAISPCPLTLNITAIGYISKNLGNKKRVFWQGVVYTIGRGIAYTLLAFVLFIGADQLKISEFFRQHGEKITGPLLFLVGFFLLDFVPLKIPSFQKISETFQNKKKYNYIDVLLLGIIFALSFCPYNGVLYFGLLIPMTLSAQSGLMLPVVFSISSGIPVIIFSWLLAYTVSSVGKLYNQIKTFEKWFKRIIALLFIGVGIYYIIIIYFK